MKPEQDARKALNALLRDVGRDMTDAEVDEMISRELDKDEGMDADLVAEALRDREAQEDQEVAQARRTANWAEIERKLDARKRSKFLKRHTRWMQAAAAVLVVFALISLGLATDAGRWNFLVRIFQPVMEETLGIHLNAGDSQSAGRVEKETSFPDDMSESVIIREEGKVPKAIKGYAAVPAWLPDGFAFEYAEVFEDSFESSQTVAYRKADLELFAQTVVYKDAETAVNVVEKNARDDARNAREIAFTENEGVVSATCEDNLACYMVWGRLSREDISSVITSLIKGAG